MKEYGSILIIIVVSIIIGIVVEVLSYVMMRSNVGQDREKMSAFECGFDAFENSREKFDIRFYLVGMLFIIFDLEASYLYPFAVSMESIGGIGQLGMMDFILELLIGVIYIYRVGALEMK